MDYVLAIKSPNLISLISRFRR